MKKSNLRNGKIQFTKWDFFILLLKISKIRNGKIQFTKWDIFILLLKISKIRNDQSDKEKCPIYEMDLWFSENIQFMTKVTEINVQFTKWTCGFQKISNLRNDQSDKGKCPIYEMDLWFPENIQDVVLRNLPWLDLTIIMLKYDTFCYQLL